MPFTEEISFQGFSTTRLAIVGVPIDENSSFMEGTRLAPQAIRDALHSDSSNMCAENEVDLSKNISWLDVGDLELEEGEKAIRQVSDDINTLLPFCPYYGSQPGPEVGTSWD